ncbi:MAG: hypothetical protein ACON32_07945, partial [Pirellulaceae bacterium]
IRAAAGISEFPKAVWGSCIRTLPRTVAYLLANSILRFQGTSLFIRLFCETLSFQRGNRVGQAHRSPRIVAVRLRWNTPRFIVTG